MLSSFISKLIVVRQFSLLENEFKILGENFYLQPIKSLVAFQDKVEEKFGKKGLDLIYETSKESFVEFAKEMKKFAESEEKFFDVLLKLISHFGFGNLEIVEIDKKGRRALVEVKNNPFAKEYIKKFGFQKKCVDHLLAGIIAGYFSEFFKEKVKCEEKGCIAKKNLSCKFLVEKAK
ncbi:MAG: 4-vinyl reductase [Candidatus Aenigmatarchaeota archaeon]